MGIEPETKIIHAWCSPFWANLAFACKYETSGPCFVMLLLTLTYARSAHEGEYQTRMTEVPGPMRTWVNILLLKFWGFL